DWVTVVAVAVVAVLGLIAARSLHGAGCERDAWICIGLLAPMLSPVSWIHHWVWLLPALIVLAFRHRSRGARVLMVAVWAVLLVGPGIGGPLVSNSFPLVAALGTVGRECLLLTSAVCVFVLWRDSQSRPVRDIRTAP